MGENEIMIDPSDVSGITEQTGENERAGIIDEQGRPVFGPLEGTKRRGVNEKSNNDDDVASKPLTAKEMKLVTKSVTIPAHRMRPLRSQWVEIYTPLVEHLGLQVRMNLKRKAVEVRPSSGRPSSQQLADVQKGVDYLHAFTLGFELSDCLALLRLDDLYVMTIHIKDIKNLQGAHLSRAIGRIAGYQGRTKNAIENTTRTRLVVADNRVHILGGYQNIEAAKTAICRLVLGQQPGKVYGQLRQVGARMKEQM